MVVGGALQDQIFDNIHYIPTSSSSQDFQRFLFSTTSNAYITLVGCWVEQPKRQFIIPDRWYFTYIVYWL